MFGKNKNVKLCDKGSTPKNTQNDIPYVGNMTKIYNLFLE